MLIKLHSAHNAKFNTAAVSSMFLGPFFKLLKFMYFHNAINTITKYTLFYLSGRWSWKRPSANWGESNSQVRITVTV